MPEHWLEAPITRRTLRRSFERFGMVIEYTVIEETMPAWEVHVEEGQPNTWRLTGGTRVTHHVQEATVRSVQERSYPRMMEVYTTADGPILGLLAEPHVSYLTLRHPALVQYASGRLQLKPIFGADRELKLYRHAITASAAPSELLLAAYPAYIICSNMGGFMQKLPQQLHTHEEEVKPRCT